MSDRYSRQERFKEIGLQGQKKLSKKTVLIVGVGGLGSISAELLTRAGIGKLILFDDDKVEVSNLQRQSLYTQRDIGKPKVLSAAKHLKEINSEVKIEANQTRLKKIDKKPDIILDGTDNMETRYILNDYAIKKKIPYVFGAAAGSDGLVFNISPYGPCLRCIYKNSKGFETANTIGIINPITHIVAATQVTEALKILLNKPPCKELIRFNPWKNKYTLLKVKKDKNCKC